MVAQLILLFLVRAISRDFNEYGRKNCHYCWKKDINNNFPWSYPWSLIAHRHDVKILKLASETTRLRLVVPLEFSLNIFTSFL